MEYTPERKTAIWVLGAVMAGALATFMHNEYALAFIPLFFMYLFPSFVTIAMLIGVVDFHGQQKSKNGEKPYPAMFYTALSFVIVALVGHVLNMMFLQLLFSVGRG